MRFIRGVWCCDHLLPLIDIYLSPIIFNGWLMASIKQTRIDYVFGIKRCRDTYLGEVR
jgi:hypothetical protein